MENNVKPPSAVISRIDAAYHEMERGVTAETVLKTLDPLLEKRLGILLDGFRQCPPELGPLLDFRASICEVWRLRKELKDDKSKGASSAAILERMMAVKTNP